MRSGARDVEGKDRQRPVPVLWASLCQLSLLHFAAADLALHSVSRAGCDPLRVPRGAPVSAVILLCRTAARQVLVYCEPARYKMT